MRRRKQTNKQTANKRTNSDLNELMVTRVPLFKFISFPQSISFNFFSLSLSLSSSLVVNNIFVFHPWGCNEFHYYYYYFKSNFLRLSWRSLIQCPEIVILFIIKKNLPSSKWNLFNDKKSFFTRTNVLLA